MDQLAGALYEQRPLNDFNLDCQDCDKTLVAQEDLTGCSFKDQLLIECALKQHLRNTGHINMVGMMEPRLSIEEISISIHLD